MEFNFHSRRLHLDTDELRQLKVEGQPNFLLVDFDPKIMVVGPIDNEIEVYLQTGDFLVLFIANDDLEVVLPQAVLGGCQVETLVGFPLR